MFKKLANANIWVKDQNEALRFYTEKLGFEIRTDMTAFGYRWLTIGLKDQPDIEFALTPVQVGGMFTDEDVAHLTKLMEAGKISIGGWKTDDCRATYETLKARGVEFLQPPTDEEYGVIQAVFKDNSGNIMVLSEDKQKPPR